MLKACLILVIALGVGALGVSQFQVKEKITELTTDLETAKQNEERALSAQRQAESAEKQAKVDLETLLGKHADTETQLEDTKRIAQQQRVRADELEAELRTTAEQRNDAQRKLAQWRALGVDIQAIQSMKDDLLAAREEISASKAEREILLREISQLKYDLSKYEGPDTEIAMKEGLKGAVVAVADNWDFVVVNIGENHGARQSGKLMVGREGKLVGKVQITTLNAEQSIANVLPGWKQADIQVGDTVLY
ncbi:MAG: hypothetical protein M2R45_03987 [Verrucomicrobia subdivision 3 bacterium]|nr:hypothetical protein [Limisphaerales bacterium]MCS1415493.1 hypothetical protein [Limisphaerales bacterium]